MESEGLSIPMMMFGAVGVILACIALVRPHFGAWFIWLLPWLYPNSLLYGMLPLNIRLDDLWIVYMGLICLVLYREGAGVSRLTLLAMLWSLFIIIGNLVGTLITNGEVWEDAFKNSAKSLYVPITTYVLSALLSRRDHLEKHIKVIMVAGMLCGLLGILMIYFPNALESFLIPSYEYSQTAMERVSGAQEEVRRAAGAVGTISLAIIMMNLSLLSLCLMLYHNRKLNRSFFAVAFGICAVSLGYTVTRGAIGGFLGAVIWGIIFTPKRQWLILLGIIGIVVLIWQTDIIGRVALRLVDGGGGHQPFWESVAVRMGIWTNFAQNFSVLYLLSGVGMSGAVAIVGASAHNTYFGSLVYAGLGGLAIMVLVIVQAIKLGRCLLGTKDPLARALGTYLIMLTLAMMAYGVVAEVFQSPVAMQLFFAALVLGQKRLDQISSDERMLAYYAEQYESALVA